jgi:hypothetical protein
MDKVFEQLKKHLEETPKEILEKECFEINCNIEGIDHNLPNAKKLLKKKQCRNRWKYNIFPKIKKTTICVTPLLLAFCGGYCQGCGVHWLWCVIGFISAGLLELLIIYKLY